MPPRAGASALSALADACPRHTTRAASSIPSTSSSTFTRSFSSTPCLGKITERRAAMWKFFKQGKGLHFKNAPYEPKYLGAYPDQPFPLNPLFRSESVLDDDARELIYSKVINEGSPLKVVSAELGVDVRRVAAVVRLKQVEREWETEGKPMALPYADAVMRMLPKTSYPEGGKIVPHEPINDIPVHSFTNRQLFVPTSESRDFTRRDAAQAFSGKLLPADARSAHTQLINMERKLAKHESAAGETTEEAKEFKEAAYAQFRESTQGEEERQAEMLQRKRERQAARTQTFETSRFEFRIKSYNSEMVGRNGKNPKALGSRYGAPSEDRKRGAVKIPTSVP